MKKERPSFSYTKNFGYTKLTFNEYSYGTYNEYLADLIIKKAEFKPYAAWRKAQKTMEHL